MKYCGCCSKDLPLDAFAKNKAKKDGLQERCRMCRASHHQATKHKRPAPTKESKRKWLISSYGLTQDKYIKMLEEQGNSCAICHSKDWGKPSPSIDHCHSTNEVRGLLCNMCNRALGMFKDNSEILENAAKYLRESRFSK
jgi:hypothetical protein